MAGKVRWTVEVPAPDAAKVRINIYDLRYRRCTRCGVVIVLHAALAQNNDVEAQWKFHNEYHDWVESNIKKHTRRLNLLERVALKLFPTVYNNLKESTE